jgi:predicted secreted protein
MSDIGYNGRDFFINLAGTKIAAVTTKTATRNREAVDVTTDDDDGNRRILPKAGSRSLDVSVEGVVSATNWTTLRNAVEGDTHLDITLENPDGTTETAQDGFFMSSLEWTGEQAGKVTFSVELMSSGPITITPAP